MQIMSKVPNFLSLLRIALSFVIFFIADKPMLLFWMILVIGLTDALDGFFARRLQCESDLGARLDSLGDLIFFCALVIYVLRFQLPLIQRYMLGIYAIFVIKTTSLVVCTLKNHITYSLHTYGNKLTGILVVVSILYILLTGSGVFTLVLVIIGVLSAIEELLIICLVKRPDVNTRSLFVVWKNRRS